MIQTINSKFYEKFIFLFLIYMVALKRAFWFKTKKEFMPSWRRQSSWGEGRPGCWGVHHPGRW